MSLKDLQQRAAELEIEGRSKLSAPELEDAIAAHPDATDAEREASTKRLADEAAKAAAAERAKTAEQAATDALAANSGNLEPATPEETGRPELVEVAEGKAADRKPRRIIGEDPNAEEDN